MVPTAVTWDKSASGFAKFVTRVQVTSQADYMVVTWITVNGKTGSDSGFNNGTDCRPASEYSRQNIRGAQLAAAARVTS